MTEEPRDDADSIPDYEEFEKRIKHLFDALPRGDVASTGASRTHDAWVGRVLDDFRIVRQIGAGGMATVYEAEQLSLDRRVALKVLPSLLSLSARAIATFHEEALALGRQHHPNIVAVHAVGEADGVHYIAQELVGDGRTLADELEERRQSGGYPPGFLRTVIGWMIDIADAVGHAHESGVVHRDLKPSNILLDEGAAPKVGDFGLAKIGGALRLPKRAEEFVGTPYYVAPEQAGETDAPIDHRVDMFSLGVTIYESVTLTRPFGGSTTADIVRNVQKTQPVHPRVLNPRVPRDVAEICLKAMEKDPARRYQTMEELREDLQRSLRGEPIRGRSIGFVQRLALWFGRHKQLASVGAAGLLGIGLAVVLWWVMASQRAAFHKTIAARFVALDQLTLPRADRRILPAWAWCRDIDPDNPEWRVLRALHLLRLDRLPGALEDLRALSREGEFATGSWRAQIEYLRGLVASRMQADPRNAPRQEALRDEARSALARSGGIDPTVSATLAIPEDERERDESPTSRIAARIRLNPDHYLVALERGVAAFDVLFLGGRRHEFQEAIQAFRTVLSVRPEHRVALTCLGRVQFFRARGFDHLAAALDGEDAARRAIAASGARPFHLDFSTLGQIALFRGDLDLAVEEFQRAIQHADERRGPNHNAHTGLAMVSLARGEWARARDLFQSHEVQARDLRTHVVRARLALATGDPELAVEFAARAQRRPEDAFGRSRETGLASAHLTAALVHVEMERFEEVRRSLDRLYDLAVYSPRDLASATLLIATLPPSELTQDDGRPGYFVKLAWNLARFAAAESAWGGESSPIASAALGVAEYLRGNHARSVEHLCAAIDARASWPASAQALQRAENARDGYFLALAAHALDGRPDGEWRQHLESADRAHAAATTPPVSFSISARARAFAHSRLE